VEIKYIGDPDFRAGCIAGRFFKIGRMGLPERVLPEFEEVRESGGFFPDIIFFAPAAVEEVVFLVLYFYPVYLADVGAALALEGVHGVTTLIEPEPLKGALLFGQSLHVAHCYEGHPYGP
jgi:hypothetical protein